MSSICSRAPYLVRVAEPKVDDLKSPTVRRRLKEKVLGLEVPMGHVVLVQVLDSVHLHANVGCSL